MSKEIYPKQKKIVIDDPEDCVFDENGQLTNGRRLSVVPPPRRRSSGVGIKKAGNVIKDAKFDGVKQILRSKTVFAKILWLSMFIMALSTLFFEVIKTANHYYYSPVTTTLRIRTPPSLAFPQVYICHGNVLNRTYLLQNAASLKHVKFIYESVVRSNRRRKRDTVNGYGEGFSDFESEADDGVRNRFERKVETGHEDKIPDEDDDFDTYDFLFNAGFSVEKTFLHCEFDSFTKRVLNCSAIVKPILDLNYFKCFLVTVPVELQQVKNARGLKLLINSQVSIYPRNETMPNRCSGVYVSVSREFDSTNWLKSVVKPGTLTKIGLTAEWVKLLNLEQGSLIQPCVDGRKHIYRVLNTTYTRTSCQMDCMMDAFYRRCGCILLADRSLLRKDVMANASFCTFSMSRQCLIPKVTQSPQAQKEIDECRQVCYTPCEEWRYSMHSSNAVLHSLPYDAGLPENSTENLTNLILLDISFSRMRYTELVQSPSKTVTDMIGDIGGHFNLWLGTSLISLLHVIVMTSAVMIFELSIYLWTFVKSITIPYVVELFHKS